MNRTAIFATLFLLVFCASSGKAADPDTFFVAFSADSARLVVVSHRGGIKVLSIPELRELRSLATDGDRRVRSAAVSPSGRWLAADNDGDLLLWNLETGEAQPAVPVAHRSSPVYVFGPDDDTLFIYQVRLRIWDVKQGREAGVVRGVNSVDMMTVSPDGRFLVVFGRCSSGRVSGNVCVCAIDEKSVVAAGDWEEIFSEPLQVPSGLSQLQFLHQRAEKPVGTWYAADLVFTKDNRILLTFRESEGRNFMSRFLKPGDLTVLDKTVVEPEAEWQYPGLRSAPTRQLEVVSPDGRWKVTGYQKRLYLYRIAGESRRALEKYVPIP